MPKFQRCISRLQLAYRLARRLEQARCVRVPLAIVERTSHQEASIPVPAFRILYFRDSVLEHGEEVEARDVLEAVQKGSCEAPAFQSRDLVRQRPRRADWSAAPTLTPDQEAGNGGISFGSGAARPSARQTARVRSSSLIGFWITIAAGSRSTNSSA